MEHVVFWTAAGGAASFSRFPDQASAVEFVGALRNEDGVTDAAVYTLAEVPIAIRTVYVVEVGADAGLTATPASGSPVAAPAVPAVPSVGAPPAIGSASPFASANAFTLDPHTFALAVPEQHGGAAAPAGHEDQDVSHTEAHEPFSGSVPSLVPDLAELADAVEAETGHADGETAEAVAGGVAGADASHDAGETGVAAATPLGDVVPAQAGEAAHAAQDVEPAAQPAAEPAGAPDGAEPATASTRSLGIFA